MQIRLNTFSNEGNGRISAYLPYSIIRARQTKTGNEVHGFAFASKRQLTHNAIKSSSGVWKRTNYIHNRIKRSGRRACVFYCVWFAIYHALSVRFRWLTNAILFDHRTRRVFIEIDYTVFVENTLQPYVPDQRLFTYRNGERYYCTNVYIYIFYKTVRTHVENTFRENVQLLQIVLIALWCCTLFFSSHSMRLEMIRADEYLYNIYTTTITIMIRNQAPNLYVVSDQYHNNRKIELHVISCIPNRKLKINIS